MFVTGTYRKSWKRLGKRAIFWCVFTSVQLGMFVNVAHGTGQNLPNSVSKGYALPKKGEGRFIALRDVSRDTRSSKVYALNGEMPKTHNLRDMRMRTPKAEEVSNEVKLAMLTGALPPKKGQKVMDDGDIAAAIAPLFKNEALGKDAQGEVNPTEDDGLATDIVLKGEWKEEAIAGADDYIWPLADDFVRISSPFGKRVHPVTRQPSFHAGIDIPAPLGTPVMAARAGEVTGVGTHPNLGRYVKITHEDGAYTLYGHLHKSTIAQHAKVKAGQQIGLVGSTGRSTGPHLDFSIRKDGKPMNPMAYLTRPDNNKSKDSILASKE